MLLYTVAINNFSAAIDSKVFWCVKLLFELISLVELLIGQLEEN